MNAVDANILIYVHDPRDRRNKLLLDLSPHLLTACCCQVAYEFVAAGRKLSAYGFTQQPKHGAGLAVARLLV